jgi:flagellar basal body-associated protein FliL
MAKGMNWGILSLLAVVVCVLSCFATFFVFLAKKSATPAAKKLAGEASPESTQENR